MKIKAIIFDLGEVLIKGWVGIDEALQAIVKKDPLLIRQELTQNEERRMFFRGLITEEGYLSLVIKCRNWPCSVDQVRQAIRASFEEIPGTRSVILQLRALGFRTALLSIHGREWIEFLDRKLGHHALFDVRDYSYDSTYLKPDPRAFRSVIRKLGLQYGECVFFDDLLRNVVAARNLGMAAFQYEDHPKLVSDLNSIGIKIEG